MKRLLAFLTIFAIALAGYADKPYNTKNYKSFKTAKGKTVNVSSRAITWRWCYNNKNELTVSPTRCSGETWTLDNIVESSSLEEALKEIEKKGITISAKMAAEIEGTKDQEDPKRMKDRIDKEMRERMEKEMPK